MKTTAENGKVRKMQVADWCDVRMAVAATMRPRLVEEQTTVKSNAASEEGAIERAPAIQRPAAPLRA